MESTVDLEEVPPTPPVERGTSNKPEDSDEIMEIDDKVVSVNVDSENSLDDFVSKSTRKKAAQNKKDDVMVELSLSRVVKRSQITDEDISVLIVKCTSCGHQVNHHNKKCIEVHPDLRVLICRDCKKFYGNGKFSGDEEGDKYCRWCGQGGTVLGCDICRNVFCSDCIRRNFGRGEVRLVRDSEWKCYVCDPSKLKEKVSYYDMIYEYSSKLRMKTKKKELHINSEDLDEVLSTILDSSIALADRFKKKAEKLKTKCITSSRKQILKTLESVLAEHRSEIKWLMGNVRENYKKYSTSLVKTSNEIPETKPIEQNGNILYDTKQNGQLNSCDVLKNKETLPADIIEDKLEDPSSTSSLVSGIDKFGHDESPEAMELDENVIDEPASSNKTVNGHEPVKKVVLIYNSLTDKYKRKPDVCEVDKTGHLSKTKSVKIVETPKNIENDHCVTTKSFDALKKDYSSSTLAENVDSVSRMKSPLTIVEVTSIKKSQVSGTNDEKFPPVTLKTASSLKDHNSSKVEKCLPKSLKDNNVSWRDIKKSKMNKTKKDAAETQQDSQVEITEVEETQLENSEPELAEVENQTAGSPKFPPAALKKQETKENTNLQDSSDSKSEDTDALSGASTVPNDSGTDEDLRRKKKKRVKRTPKKDRNAALKARSQKSPTKSRKGVDASDFSSWETSSIDSVCSVSKIKTSRPRLSQEKKNFSRNKDSNYLSNKELFLHDWKLWAPCTVPIQRLEIDPEIIKETLELYHEASSDVCETKIDEGDMSELDYLEKEAERLLKRNDEKPKPKSSDDVGPLKSKSLFQKKIEKKKSKARKSSSSDMISLSSSSEEEKFEKIIAPLSKVLSPDRALNVKSKIKLLSHFDDTTTSLDETTEDESPEEIKKKKSTTKTDSKKNNSSENTSTKENTETEEQDDNSSGVEFIKRKKKKTEKLLRAPLRLSDDDFKSDQNKNEDKKRKTLKRKVIYSDDDSKDAKKSGGSTCTTESDSSSREGRRRKRSKKGRKRVKISDSSEEQSGNKEEKVKDKQDTPGKGRKNIRKVISHRKLQEETKAAQDEEKERRKRISEKQKMYNQITENIGDEHNKITKKFVLEIDPESKEEVVEIHPDIIEKLKPHQVNGVRFMWESTIESLKRLETEPGSGCILAHCMGLGKTLQVIAFLYTLFCNRRINKKIRTAMIICPYNTVLNWINEFNVWLADCDHSLNIYDITPVKTNRDRIDYLAEWQECGGVLVLGYNMFSRLAEGKLNKLSGKFKQRVIELITDPGPDIVVCDEGHMLKNESSALSKAASKLKTRRRVVLTGTPLQNNLKEYHCMMQFVKPNLLGTSKEFLNRFVNPIINGQYDNSSKHDVQVMKKRVHILHKLLEGCVQRCDYSALTKFLPLKLEFVISVKLSEVQIKLYRKYLDANVQGGPTAAGGKLFQDYQSLKNVWTYPHMLFMAFERSEQRKLMSEFLNEDEYDTNDSFINDDSEDEANASKKDDESSEEEVIRSYRLRSFNPDEVEEEAKPTRDKQWFEDFITEEDKFKMEFSGKMVLVFEILKECEMIGDKVLIFSQSLHALDVLEMLLRNYEEEQAKEAESQDQELNKSSRDYTYGTWTEGIDYFRMDGSTNVENRKHWIELFNDLENPRARLFLISTKAGSLGTNLVGANRVIMLDASWNPSHDVQAIFRVYRFGQVKPVYIYRLLAQGTMEEKIYNRQVTKLSLSCRVVDEQQIDRHFSAAQLAELYTFEPDSQTNRPTPMVPKDRLLADLLRKQSDWIVTYHEHDSLLQCSNEVDLTEEERQAAWTEYENEKEGIFNNAQEAPFVAGTTFSDHYFFVPDIDEAVKLLIRNVRKVHPQISNADLWKSILAQLGQLKKNLQSRHLMVLRQKQEAVSKSIPFPAHMQTLLKSLEQALERIFRYTDQFQKEFDRNQNNMGSASGTNSRQPPFAPTNVGAPRSGTNAQFYQPRFSYARNLTGNIFPQANFAGARLYCTTSATGVNYVPRPAAPKPTQSAVIVDVSDENETVSSNDIPIVVEAEESFEESTEEQASTTATAPPASSSSSCVKITEIS